MKTKEHIELDVKHIFEFYNLTEDYLTPLLEYIFNLISSSNNDYTKGYKDGVDSNITRHIDSLKALNVQYIWDYAFKVVKEFSCKDEIKLGQDYTKLSVTETEAAYNKGFVEGRASVSIDQIKNKSYEQGYAKGKQDLIDKLINEN